MIGKTSNPLKRGSWSPYVVGVAIGVLSWFAFATAGNPLGITTAFENTAALVERAAFPNAAADNELFAQKAKENKQPKIDWEWMLVLGVFFGAHISSRLSGDRTKEKVPALWSWRFGPGVARRYVGAFAGGAVMMLGARLAQGCTSGHGISGALQLADADLGEFLNGPARVIPRLHATRQVTGWDALFVIAGMMAGSFLFAEASAWLTNTVQRWGDRGKVTLPQALAPLPRSAVVAGCALLLVLGLIILERLD